MAGSTPSSASAASRAVDFEQLFAQTGTTIVKRFLHISDGEQRRRRQARIDGPNKHWRFNAQDLEERKLWHQDADESAPQRTATAHAPWYIVPADGKTRRDHLVVSTILLETLRRLAPERPPLNPGYEQLRGA